MRRVYNTRMSDPAPPATTSLPRNVKVLGLTSLLNDIATEMVYPLLPFFLQPILGAGYAATLGIIEGAAESVSSLLKLFSGGWSDRAGRRKGFVLVGYTLAVLTRPLLALVSAPWHLAVLRIGDRFGKGIRTAPRDALIADSAPRAMHGRAFGFHRAMDHLGAAIGPLLAAAYLWFVPEDYSTLFLLTAIPGLMVLALLVFALREPPPVTPPKERLRLTLAPFDARFKLFLLALFVFTLGNSSDLFLLSRAREVGVTQAGVAALWCVFHIAKSAGNIVLGRAADRFGARPLIFLGWVVYAGVYLAFAFIDAPWQVWALFMAYALFYGLTEPAEKALAAELAGPERKGLAFGWFNFAIGVAAFPASAIFGWLYGQFGPVAAFGWGASLAAAAVLLLAFVPRR